MYSQTADSQAKTIPLGLVQLQNSSVSKHLIDGPIGPKLIKLSSSLIGCDTSLDSSASLKTLIPF